MPPRYKPSVVRNPQRRRVLVPDGRFGYLESLKHPPQASKSAPMNTLVPAAMALIFTAALAAAEAPATLVEVKKYSGFVPAELSYSLECIINSDATLRQYTLGTDNRLQEETVATQYTSHLKDADAVRKFIWAAEGADVTITPGPVDGPTNFYTGILQGKVIDLHVKLSQYNGGSGQILRNTAPGLADLEEFANLNCPEPKRP
jgi:hypothetical protein